MKYKLILSAEAQHEVLEAVRWYKEKAPLLDKEFLKCLENGFSMILRNPKMFTIVHKNYHKVLIQRFPYQIIYTIYDETILVLAVFHAKRNPEKWKNR